MPDRDRMRALLREPLETYYETIRTLGKPRTGIAAVFGPIADALRRYQARAKLREELRHRIAQLHLESAREVRGGVLPWPDAPVVRAQIERQFEHLDAFMRDLDNLSEGQAKRRLMTYVPMVVQTASVVLQNDLPTLPHRPGDTDLACRGFCQCHLQIVALDGVGNWDVTWVVNPAAEHCEDCLELAAAWNPLRVRGGQIVGQKSITKEQSVLLVFLAEVI